MKFTRQIDTIVIHCSDSPNGRNDKAKDIDLWHRQKGWRRTGFWRLKKGFNPDLTSIGYHYVIDLCGKVETGRHPDETGAHVKDHNSTSIGICLVGTDRFSPEQWSALDSLVQQFQADITRSFNPVKHVRIAGHCEFDTAQAQGKTCPNFDVPAWLENGRIPQAKNVYLAD